MTKPNWWSDSGLATAEPYSPAPAAPPVVVSRRLPAPVSAVTTHLTGRVTLRSISAGEGIAFVLRLPSGDRADAEVLPWSATESELVLRPRGRWTSFAGRRRLERFYDAADIVASDLATALEAASHPKVIDLRPGEQDVPAAAVASRTTAVPRAV